MKPVIYTVGPYNFFMWNLDASVGKSASNSSHEDILYIQYCYYLGKKDPRISPERLAIYSKVKLTGVCDGTAADPLVQAITVHQHDMGHPVVDGKVSVAKGTGKVAQDAAFFVYRLGARLATMYQKVWPRLDLMPECPAPLAACVRSVTPVMPQA